MSGIACPNCGSQDFIRHRQPMNLADVTFRRHRCQSCLSIFLTAQVAVSGQVAEKMLALMEQPKPSSGPTPNASATSPRTLLDLMREGDSIATTESRG